MPPKTWIIAFSGAILSDVARKAHGSERNMDCCGNLRLCFKNGRDIIVLPHKLNKGKTVRNAFLLFGKNALPFWHSLWFSNSLCGNKRGCAFFSVWLRLGSHTFLILGGRDNEVHIKFGRKNHS